MCLKCLHAYYMLRKVAESPRLASGDGTLEGAMDANGVSSFVFFMVLRSLQSTQRPHQA